MSEIDLGRTCKDCTMPVSQTSDKDTVHYPSVYIDGAPELAKLPESGVMTVAFKVCSRTVTDRDGKKSCSISLDLKKILDVEGDVSNGEGEKDTVSILEDLAKESEGDEDSD